MTALAINFRVRPNGGGFEADGLESLEDDAGQNGGQNSWWL